MRRRRSRNGTVAALGDGTPDEELFAEIEVPGQDEFADHPLRPEDTVQAAREWVEEAKGGQGGQCPVCGRIAVIKQYDITPDQAKLLIHMYRRCGTTYVNVREFEVGRRLADHNNLVAKMAMRGLLKGKPGRGGKGTYRLTDAGVRWVLNREGAPAILTSYNRYGEAETSEHTVFISEVLRANRRRSVTGHQTYEELMAGVEGFAPPAPDVDENWMGLAS